MSMYSIIELGNGDFQCICRIQDGTERWPEKSKAIAMRSLIGAAKAMNGATITEQDIHFEAHIPHFTSAEPSPLATVIQAKELKMTMTMNLREVEVTADQTDQKDSGWHGPFKLDSDTAMWIQNALDESNLDLVLGTEQFSDEVYVKVAPKPQEVDSSMMDNVSYDDATQQLAVTFKNGSLYHYYDVEQPIADGLTQADSKGRFFIRHIRPWYKFKRIN